MKTLKISFLALLFSSFFMSCVIDNKFTVPENLGVEENENLNFLLDSIDNQIIELKSIKDLKLIYNSGSVPVKIVSDIVVKGFVVSSDESGNYFKEFYMQDAPENPTSGIKIAINLTNSYNKFNYGREVYIRLKGLYIGELNSGDGLIAIGGNVSLTNSNEIQSVSSNQIESHFFRATTTAEIIPKQVSLAGLNASDIGTFIRVNNLVFPSDLAGKAYVDTSEDFDTHRKIQSCQTVGFASLLLETSSFANFANEALPVGGGFIDAVVSKDYDGHFLVLILNSTKDIMMQQERCTTLSEADFPMVLLEENFENTTGEIRITDWVNYRQEGTKSWRSYTDTYSQSKAARIGSSSSNDAATITWLITKGVDLDNTSQEFLSFKTSNSFANGSTLEVFISTDWNEDLANINLATWTLLPANIVADGEGFKNWIHSTYIDVSMFSGKAFFAFKYNGSGNTYFDGTYELDDIKINAR